MERRELLADLAALSDDLRRVGAEAAANGPLRDLIRLVEVFGLHMLTLDVRQHKRLAWPCPGRDLRLGGGLPSLPKTLGQRTLRVPDTGIAAGRGR